MNLTSYSKHENIRVMGEAILLASLQFAIGSVEMSSKFSILNFTRDQQTLNNGVASLRSYLVIGILWAIGTVMLLYASHGMVGAMSALIANLVVLLWFTVSYMHVFKLVTKKYGLVMPSLFQAWQP